MPDAADLLHLAEWCRRYTPWTRPDGDAALGGGGVLLDVTGCAGLFGGEAALLDDLSRRLAGAGLAHRLAIADTPGTAWAVARFGAEEGAAIVAPGGGRAALAPLPVAALGLDSALVTGLRRVGIGRVADLIALPRAPLAARFGEAVATRLDQALGLLPEPVMPLAPAPERRVRLAFAEPIATAEPIAAAARRLLDDLCPRLAAEGIGALRLALDLFRVDAAVQRLAIGTARPSRDPAHLYRLLAEKLPLVEPGFGIELAMLSLVESAPLSPEAISLRLEGRLDGETRGEATAAGEGEVLAMAAELSPLVDRIQNRLGYSALHRPAPRASHVPERAVTALAPFAPDPPEALRWPAASAPRPLRLLRRPELVEVTAPVPDDPPILFRWRSALHRVRRADGPERIAAEWWRDEDGIRDYYRVEDEAGRRFWLYRSGLHDQTAPPRWFLHGFFA